MNFLNNFVLVIKNFVLEIKKSLNFQKILGTRFHALAVKEITELLRNKQFLFILLFPPTIQLCLYGFVLSPDVHNMKLAIVDDARILESRELVSALTENKIFVLNRYVKDQNTLGKLVQKGTVDVGLLIPPEFSRDIKRDKQANVQVLIDGVNAYVSGIASGYISLMTYYYNLKQFPSSSPPLVNPQIYYMYNPGLVYSWFYVLGVLGIVITITSSLTSSVESIREKSTGTLEQLLMTPASSFEILLAKIVPIFLLLNIVVVLSLALSVGIFHVPIKGNILLFFLLSAFYLIIGISIGLLIGTVSQNNMQVILTGFFINLPLVVLSGAITPIESMPPFFQWLTLLNPLRHYIVIVRGIIQKGVGLEILWPEVLALFCFAVVLLGISSYKFRSQLS